MFRDELRDLLDVARQEALELLTIEEDRASLVARDKRGAMIEVDKNISRSVKYQDECKSKQFLQQEPSQFCFRMC